MKNPIQKVNLSQNWRHLLRLMESIDFGRLENLRLQDGEPLLDEDLAIVKSIRIDTAGEPLRPFIEDEATLQAAADEAVRKVGRLAGGLIQQIDLRFGLPQSMLQPELPGSADRLDSEKGSVADGVGPVPTEQLPA